MFEHTTLPVGGQFTSTRFARLVQYNERHGNRFFDVGHNRIHFRNCVGVIQVGNLTIEILPKADKTPDSPAQKRKWQRALVEMLRQSGFIRLASVSDARLRLRASSLLDIYFESFLAEVEDLVHHGLVRKYRQTRGNLPALKGRILFQQHLSQNLVHRERFFTEHVFYDRNNRFNQVLRVALDVLARVSANPHLVALARSLSMTFQDVDDIAVSERTFTRLPHTRNTERYRRALQLARLIILNYSPDVRSGREDVLAILFDMNCLFERFIYAQLKRAEARQPSHKITFKAQVSRRFWMAERMQMSVRPDIIAQLSIGSVHERIVLDTKWKIPGGGRSGDSDLHQMHSYNVQLGAQRSILLYPRVSAQRDVEGTFAQAAPPLEAFAHYCGMMFVELFDGEKLRRDLGDDLITRLAAHA
ncbi:MAG: restriction endonuclease [Candidatus Aureabacteria bacterium]|nr:restriction endonuclease [Candidatus Auribacterota bacterium]